MLSIELSANEARVIGCLIEKSIVTPEQYPLTLNALTGACNQKTARDPVMSLDQGTVQHVARELESKNLLRVEAPLRGRSERYVQRFCNTRYSELQFDEAELAIVCLLLLRGPQTPGELRTRSARMHTFVDNDAVVDALQRLSDREGGALVVRLSRTPGRRDSEYAHLFCGEPTSALPEPRPRESVRKAEAPASLTQRVEQLEREVAALKARLDIE